MTFCSIVVASAITLKTLAHLSYIAISMHTELPDRRNAVVACHTLKLPIHCGCNLLLYACKSQW